FWICAFIGFAAGLIWFLAARDTPERHPLVSPSELEIIRRGLTLESTPAANRAKGPWREILAHRSVLFLTLSYFCYDYVACIFFAWFFTYLARVRGLTLKSSAFYATLPFLAMA